MALKPNAKCGCGRPAVANRYGPVCARCLALEHEGTHYHCEEDADTRPYDPDHKYAEKFSANYATVTVPATL